jgi:GTPase SAR1 family protein
MSTTILDQFYRGFARRLEEQREKEAQRGKKKPLFVQFEEKRFAKNMDARSVIAGEGGIGKSTLALRLAEIENPSLYVDKPDDAVEKAVSFTGRQYMDGVRTLPSVYAPPAEPLERTVLDFDEPGQAWYHRQFMSDVNMILSKTFIGFRYKRFNSKLSVPNIDFLDLDALRLVGWLFWVPAQGVAEVFRVMVQKFGGNPWYKKVIDRMTFGKPRARLWHLYEQKKFKIQDELYVKYGRKMEQLEMPQLTNMEVLKLIQEDPKKYMKGGRIDAMVLQLPPPRGFGLALNRSYLIKAMCENEGGEPNPVDDALPDTSAEELLKKIQGSS